jgi:hypothetical protein
MAIGEATKNAFVAFVEGVVPPTLTEESAGSLSNRIKEQYENGGGFGGLPVAGVGRYIADHLPVGMSHEELAAASEVIDNQVSNVGGSMVRWYEESQARA